MKTAQKFTALILLLCLLLSLVACAADVDTFSEVPSVGVLNEEIDKTQAAAWKEPEDEIPAVDDLMDAPTPDLVETLPPIEGLCAEPEEPDEAGPEVYSTGNHELDEKLDDIIERLTIPENSFEDNLHELYRYVRSNFGYRKKDKRTAENMEEWVFQVAEDMIDEGAGNCYSFASLLYCLFRRYGFDEARICVGTFCKSPHGWVEAEIEDTVYGFDVETEYASLARKRKPDHYVNCFYRTYYQLKQFTYVKEGDCCA